MVDLVKIRKKARKEREEAASDPVSSAPAADPAQPPASTDSPGQPAGGRKKSGERRTRSAGMTSTPAPAEPDPGTPAVERTTPAEAAPLAVAEPLPGASSKLERFKELAGRRRHAQSQADTESTDQGQQERLEMLTFVIGREQYAVDIERIVEIVTPRPVTRIPNSDPAVVGIISLRGTIVTLVDVRRKLRHGVAPADDAETRVVVMDYGTETVGFTVDRVLRVVKVAPGEIEPHPVVHATELDEAIRGVFRVAGALTILLDLDKLLATSR